MNVGIGSKCLEYLCWIVISVCSVLAALFELRDRAQTEGERRITREQYKNKWIAIRDTKLLELPEIIITKYLKAIDYISGAFKHPTIDQLLVRAAKAGKAKPGLFK